MRVTSSTHALRIWLIAISATHATLCYGDPPPLNQPEVEFAGKGLIGQGNLQPTRGGIGIFTVSTKNIGLEIEGVIPGSSAARAGLKAGWIITMADDVSLAGLTLTKCIQSLTGPPGTFVRIEVVDLQKPDKVRVFRLMRQDFAKFAGANPAPQPRGGANVVVEEARPFYSEVEDEIVGTFSGIDEGAAESIRAKFGEAEIPFRIADGTQKSITVSPLLAIKARAILLQLQSKGHWSILTSAAK